jgi:hypothetical protein
MTGNSFSCWSFRLRCRLCWRWGGGLLVGDGHSWHAMMDGDDGEKWDGWMDGVWAFGTGLFVFGILLCAMKCST